MSTTKTSAAGKRTNHHNYLTKRILARAAKAGVKKASERTMKVMGYNVIAHDGWIINKYADGRIERISKIKPVRRTRKIALD